MYSAIKDAADNPQEKVESSLPFRHQEYLVVRLGAELTDTVVALAKARKDATLYANGSIPG